jgi:DNA helicase II / ATP-dependent DNA helicase PcrA
MDGKKFALFAQKVVVIDLINGLKLYEDKGNIKTIHGAKGSEYDSVLLYLNNDEIDYLIDPKINDSSDDCRIYYVALSRAKDLLFISSPSLFGEKRARLSDLGIRIVDL